MEFSKLSYSQHNYLKSPNTTELNTVDVWRYVDQHPPKDDRKLWIIYIHGGAWRDPEVDSKSFEPSVRVLCQSGVMKSVAGFASINYRLSPYPSHPRIPSSPDDSSRNVHHPVHVSDVACALNYLEEHYQIRDRYVLVGHSAGATIIFQLRDTYLPNYKIPKPLCVLGVSGIYDFQAFVDAHRIYPVYEEIMSNAFGDQNLWKDFAPYTDANSDRNVWQGAQSVIISHSDTDELVEKGQAVLMLECARKVACLHGKIHYLEATGSHDEIWQSGHILAKLITRAMETLFLHHKEHS